MTRIALPGLKPGSPLSFQKDPTMSRLSKSEQEIHLSKCADEDCWTLYCTDPSALSSFLALAKKVGGTVTRAQGGTRISFPLDSIFIGVKRKYNLSPDQRQERATQMKALRAGQSATHLPPTMHEDVHDRNRIHS